MRSLYRHSLIAFMIRFIAYDYTFTLTMYT